MKSIIIIEEFKTFEVVNFYTIRFEDQELSETDRFLKRIKEEYTEYHEDLDIILNWISEVGKRGLTKFN